MVLQRHIKSDFFKNIIYPHRVYVDSHIPHMSHRHDFLLRQLDAPEQIALYLVSPRPKPNDPLKTLQLLLDEV